MKYRLISALIPLIIFIEKGFPNTLIFSDRQFFTFLYFCYIIFDHKFPEFGLMSAILFSFLFNQKITHNLIILIFNQIVWQHSNNKLWLLIYGWQAVKDIRSGCEVQPSHFRTLLNGDHLELYNIVSISLYSSARVRMGADDFAKY